MRYKVIFQPSGRRGEVEAGKTLQQASQELGVEIESICGGKKTCGKCKITIQEGFFEKFAIDSKMSNLSPLTEEEREKLKPEEIDANYRLSCAAEIGGEVLVFVPEESRGGGQIIRKAATDIEIAIDPAIRKYYVELPKATLEDPEGDLERLLSELEKVHKLKNLSIDYLVLRSLPTVIREGDWKVTTTVWQDKEIMRVEPGLRDERYGIAIDIGTTTVVGYLTDLHTGKVIAVDSMMNPQVKYGEDVMARITYAMTHEDGLEKMHEAIIGGLNKIIDNVTKEAELTPEDILEVVAVGNTCMHHIFLKFNPEPVGLSPFPPTAHHSIDVKARDLGLRASKGANVHVLPIEAGFVGADNMGVILAVEPEKSDDILLVIDIGTNGEIVLGNKKKLLSTSCATGPAFEGAQIKHGMRAAPGAIERVKVDPETYEVEFKVIGKTDWHTHYLEADVNARGICGSGIIEAIAEMFKAGIIKKNGNFNPEIKTSRLRKGDDGQMEFVLAWKGETSVGKDITVTLGDVRAMQLAKGALYTGCKTLMKRYGVTEVDKVILAGAFGSYIDKEAAMTIGMFPDCDLKKVMAVGNAAGDGARIALLNRRKREEANIVARKIKYIELTVDPDFQTEFMKAMHFPHMKDEFPHLNAILNKIPR
ncbi:MAG: ASKHA domain-containing protein [Candidatus Hydrothermarchaeales archaeon]